MVCSDRIALNHYCYTCLAGSFLNHKNSPFPTLTAIVMAYQTRHDDMQTIITEYIPNKPVAASAQGKPVYQNVALSKVSGAVACMDGCGCEAENLISFARLG